MYSLFLIFKDEFKNMYPRWTSPFIHMGLIATNLIFYWYFSKAINSKAEYTETIGENYFWYLLIGELSLILPIKFLSKPPLILKQLYMRSLLQEFLMFKNKLLVYLVQSTFCQLILELSKFIIILMLLSVSGIAHSFSVFISLIFLQLIYVPLFISLGFLACHIVIYFGRGEKIVQIIVSVLFILAGAYFPTEVLPFQLHDFLKHSPLNLLVNDCRSLFKGSALIDIVNITHISLLISGSALSCLFYYSFKFTAFNTDRPLSHKPFINGI